MGLVNQKSLASVHIPDVIVQIHMYVYSLSKPDPKSTYLRSNYNIITYIITHYISIKAMNYIDTIKINLKHV